MDEIQQRLTETVKACSEAYEAWTGNSKDIAVREKLQESVHELRKVASRLEIEIAMSERDQMTSKRIPIPPHRAAKKNHNRHDNDQAHSNGRNDKSSGANVDDATAVAVKKITRKPRKPKEASGE